MSLWRSTIRKNKARLLETTEEKEKRFHAAANDGNIFELGLLLESGDVDVNCRGDLAAWTPLHTAASNGHVTSVEMLIAHKAAVDITDMFGCTPLFYATRNGHQDVVQLLLSKHASASIRNQWGEVAMETGDKTFCREVLSSKESFSSQLIDMDESRKDVEDVENVPLHCDSNISKRSQQYENDIDN